MSKKRENPSGYEQNGEDCGEGTARYPEKKKTRRRLTKQQKLLIVIFLLLAAALALVLAYQGMFVRPELPAAAGEGDTSEISADGTAPKASGQRKSDDYYTILLLGRDTGGGGNCDTMMLVSYDVTNQKMTVMSIPRDTMVNVPWDVKKINSVYNYYGGGEKGIAALNSEISDLIGFVPDYSVIVEWEAVGELVDAIGGVYYDVPRNMDYEDPYQDLSIHISKGYQKLDGQQAMGVVRFRDGKNGYNNGDLGRIETQQGFMKAVISQLLQIQNVSKIQKFSRIFEENVTTDLTVQNLFWFGKSAILGGLSMDNVTFVTMPNTTTSCWCRTYHNYQSYVVPKANELLELVNTALSPFQQEVTLSELDIMSVNKNGSVSSTTGHVEDSRAASAPAVSSGTSKTPVDNEGTGQSNTASGGTETGTGTGTDTGAAGSTSGSASSSASEPPGDGSSSAAAGSSASSSTGGNTSGTDSGDGFGGTPAEPTVPAEPSGGTETNAAA